MTVSERAIPVEADVVEEASVAANIAVRVLGRTDAVAVGVAKEEGVGGEDGEGVIKGVKLRVGKEAVAEGVEEGRAETVRIEVGLGETLLLPVPAGLKDCN